MLKKTKQIGFAKTRRRGGFTRQQVKSIQRIRDAGKETNVYDHEVLSPATVSTTVTLSDVTAGIAQGDGVGQRIGDRLSPTSILGRVRLFFDGTATAGSIDVVRYMIIQWHPDNVSDTPTSAKIFENPTYPSLSMLVADKNYRSKFSVLFDRTVTLSYGADDRANRMLYPKILKIADVKYTPASTSGSNHIYEVYAGSVASGSSYTDISHELYLRYKDM